MKDHVAYRTDFGIYWVTPADKKLLDRDMALYGQICVAPRKNGTAKRLDPTNVLYELERS